MNDTVLLILRAVGMTVGLVVGGTLMRYFPPWIIIIGAIALMTAARIGYNFLKEPTENSK